MTAENVFERMVSALDRAGIPYMLTGSFASSYHGVPRATQDIDFVISPTADQLRAFATMLPHKEYYLDLEAALEAQQRHGQFNVIDLATGWKVDLIVRKSRLFSREEFDRRGAVEFQGMQLVIATAEDVLLAKLEWARLGESHRQLEDAAGILRVRGTDLDHAYIQRWVGQLDLVEQWQAARRMAGIAT